MMRDQGRPRNFLAGVEPSTLMCVKTCSICNQEKPETNFYSTREGTVYGPCIDCRRKAGIERNAERKQRARQNFERLAGQA
jgi:hypothetical protein